MGERNLEKWTSEYTLASKEATNGKLKEVFRGREELDKYIGEVESVIVHAMSPQAGFDIIGRGRRILYVWTNEVDILTSESYGLKEDEKVFIDSRYDKITVGSKSSAPSLIVEVCSLPISEVSYKRVGDINTKHLPVLRESKEALGGQLNQITVHNFGAYDYGGNHFHLNAKMEFFLVAKGLVYVFERRVDKHSTGFEVPEALKRIKSKDKDYAISLDSFGVGGRFSFCPIDRDGFLLSHATASKKGAKFIELTSIAFDPEHYNDSIGSDILVPEDYNERKKLIDLLSE